MTSTFKNYNLSNLLISEMLGHSSASFTYNTYVHLIEEEKAKVIKRIKV